MKKKLCALLLSVLLAAGPLTGCAGLLPAASTAAQESAQQQAALQLVDDDNAQPSAAPQGGLVLLDESDDAPEAQSTPTHAPLTLLEDSVEDNAESAAPTPKHTPKSTHTPKPASAIDEDGSYTSRDDVALYLVTYGHLPENFITKNEARSLGWSGGGLDDYAYGKCIGGDRFGNYEGLLPEKSGRRYTECDVDTLHKKSRGPKRIIFSNDGLIYYTGDHYESFTLLYGEE